MNRYLLAFVLVVAATNCIAEEGRRELTVSAKSELRVTPDEAVLEFQIESKDNKSLPVAKKANDALAVAVVKVVKAQAIPAEDFRVTNVTLGPEYSQHHNLLGYQVVRDFQIRTKDFGKIDGLVSALVDACGDSLLISELHLQVRDQRKHQTEARRLAVEYAREKASHLAALNGMKLGDAVTITEDVEYNHNAGGFGGFGGGGFGISVEAEPRPGAEQADRAAAAPPSIPLKIRLVSAVKDEAPPAKTPEIADKDVLLSPGQVSLNAEVKIKFELLPNR